MITVTMMIIITVTMMMIIITVTMMVIITFTMMMMMTYSMVDDVTPLPTTSQPSELLHHARSPVIRD